MNTQVFVLLWCWFAMLAAISLLVMVRSCLTLAAYTFVRRSASRNRCAGSLEWERAALVT